MPDTESGTQPVMSAHNVLRSALFCFVLCAICDFDNSMFFTDLSSGHIEQLVSCVCVCICVFCVCSITFHLNDIPIKDDTVAENCAKN